MNWIKTGSAVFRLKQTHVELISETVRQSFFQEGKKWLWQNLLRVTNMSWNLLHSIFSKQKSLTIAAFTLAISRFFLLFDRKRYTNNSTRRFTRHNLFEANRHTLVKRCGRYFHQRKKEASPKLFLPTQIRVDISALYFLQTTSRERSYC